MIWTSFVAILAVRLHVKRKIAWIHAYPTGEIEPEALSATDFLFFFFWQRHKVGGQFEVEITAGRFSLPTLWSNAGMQAHGVVTSTFRPTPIAYCAGVVDLLRAHFTQRLLWKFLSSSSSFAVAVYENDKKKKKIREEWIACLDQEWIRTR